MIRWESIPIWLRCTGRNLINPEVKGSIYKSDRSYQNSNYNKGRRFTDNEVRNMRGSGKRAAVLAREYDCGETTMQRILSRKTYSDVVD